MTIGACKLKLSNIVLLNISFDCLCESDHCIRNEAHLLAGTALYVIQSIRSSAHRDLNNASIEYLIQTRQNTVDLFVIIQFQAVLYFLTVLPPFLNLILIHYLIDINNTLIIYM